MLCCPGSSKPPLEGGGQEKNITGHRLILKCAVAAMDRMTRSAVITIHTDSEYLAEGHGRLASWRENDWKKSSGQKIRNSDLWKLLEEKFKTHAVRFRVESMLPYTKSPPI